MYPSSALAHVDAPHRITSTELEKQISPIIERINARPDIIQSLTGIVARRFWEPGRQPSEAATMAAEKAIMTSGIDRSQIGILVNTSVCRDYIEPSVACLVHGNLGLGPECMNFDVGNACLGFLNGLEIIGNMIERGQVDYGIVVDGEGSRFVVETTIQRLLASECDAETFRANFATFTLGSGGAAMVMAHSDLAPTGHRLLSGVSLAATQHKDLCRGQTDSMQTDASALLVAGLQLAGATFNKAKNDLGWRPEDLDQFILHQVSAVHHRQAGRTAGSRRPKGLQDISRIRQCGSRCHPHHPLQGPGGESDRQRRPGGPHGHRQRLELRHDGSTVVEVCLIL